jgi:hypothetical protein
VFWLKSALDCFPTHIQYQTAKIASKTGLEGVFPVCPTAQGDSTEAGGDGPGEDVKHAWLLKQSHGTATQVTTQRRGLIWPDNPIVRQRLDLGFKYLLAIILIDSQWSWSHGPKRLFDALCAPILEAVRLPDLKNMHPRQVLERLMRKKRCTALEVRKSKTASGAAVEGEEFRAGGM